MSDGIDSAKTTLDMDTEYVTLMWPSGYSIRNEGTFTNDREGPRNTESSYTLTKEEDNRKSMRNRHLAIQQEKSWNGSWG